MVFLKAGTQTCTFEGPGLQKHHQNSTRRPPERERKTREDTQRAKQRAKMGAERGKKKARNFGWSGRGGRRGVLRRRSGVPAYFPKWASARFLCTGTDLNTHTVISLLAGSEPDVLISSADVEIKRTLDWSTMALCASWSLCGRRAAEQGSSQSSQMELQRWSCVLPCCFAPLPLGQCSKGLLLFCLSLALGRVLGPVARGHEAWIRMSCADSLDSCRCRFHAFCLA